MTQHGSASGDWYGARLAGIALVLTIGVGIGPAAAAPNGGPGPQGNPGPDRAQEVRADKQPTPTRRRAHGTPGASKGRKVRRRGKAAPTPSRKGRTPPRANDGPPPQAKAGKTTICHSTGSETNPYVQITVSNNALKAHARHHDGADIIPAPTGGCETQVAAAQDAGTQGATTSERRRDAANARSDVRGAERSAERRSERRSERPAGGVLAAQASRPADERDVGSIAEEEDDERSLPFTGLALLGILGAAALALGAGAAARRAAGRADG